MSWVRWLQRALPAMTIVVAMGSGARADTIPDWLPQYDLDIQLDTTAHVVKVVERVKWTNRHARPANELVFNVYPRYKIPKGDLITLVKTLELLRTSPDAAANLNSGHFEMHAVTDAAGAQAIPFHFYDELCTAMRVDLPCPVKQGESVTIEMHFTFHLPHMQGRWGWWKDVIFLANWYPVLAYYDDTGWQPTPFVAWHQPFFNEAGVYSVRLKLPKDQKVASTGSVREERDLGDGCKELMIIGCCAREFAIVCSHRFIEICGQAEKAQVRVLAYPEHEYLARKALESACEVIPIYNRWFGVYPYEKFDIVESHFPWNGNECSGLIMIDERVFAMPKMAEMYVDHLVSHETLHQWWYNVVGTNGYCETFMDESVVSFYNAKRIQAKYGKNAPMIRLPHGFQWMPNVHHEDFRFNGMYGTLARHEETKTVQPLPDFGNIVTLFSMTYERGAKIFGMIEERIGEEAFYDFMKLVYNKYQFRVLRVADYQRELEAYTGRSWDEFFRCWLYGVGMSDWAVESVKITDPVNDPDKLNNVQLGPQGYRVSVIVKQCAEFTEPTCLGVKFDKTGPYEIRIPVHPGAMVEEGEIPVPAKVETLPDGKVRVEMLLPKPPCQISVDPDQVLLDRNPTNNHWKSETSWRVTPLYTPLDETDLTTPYDRWSIIMGPWVGYTGSGMGVTGPGYEQDGRVGFRAGAYRLQEFKGGVFLSYETDDQDVVLGGDALIDHWPWHDTQVGINFDHSITPDWAETRRDRARIFGRYVIHYSSSFYMAPIEFVDVYARVENEFWQDAGPPPPGVERYDDLAAVGIHYHRDYLTPYWDPVGGYRLDLNYEYGAPVLGGDETYHRLEGEFSIVQGLPSGLGYLSDTRVAARLYGGQGFPLNGEHFQLGGSRRFRGMERATLQGSAMWLASLEWRFPIWRDINCDVCDNVLRWNHLYGVCFYDFGEMFLNKESLGGVHHAVGMGLRMDMSVVSFIERFTLRMDLARGLDDDGQWMFWFGMQHAF
jgi:peptidase M1-like protein/surface antigen Omp85-like protein